MCDDTKRMIAVLFLLLALCATGAAATACDCSTTPGATCWPVSDPYTNLTWSCVKQLQPSVPTPWMRMLLNGQSTNKSTYSNRTLYVNDIPALLNQAYAAPDMVYAASVLQGTDPTQFSTHVMEYEQFNIGGDVGVVNGLVSRGMHHETGLRSLHLNNPQLTNYTGSIWFKLDYNTSTYDSDAYAQIADSWEIHFLPNSSVGTVKYLGTITLPVHLKDVYWAVWTISTAQVCLYLRQYGASSGTLVNTTSQCAPFVAGDGTMQDSANSQLQIGYPFWDAPDPDTSFIDFNVTTWDLALWTTVFSAQQASNIYLTSLPAVNNTCDCSTTPGAVCRAVNDPFTTIKWSCERQLDPSLGTPWQRVLLNGESSNKTIYSDQSVLYNDVVMEIVQAPDAPDFVYGGSYLIGQTAGYDNHVMTYVQHHFGGDVGVVNALMTHTDEYGLAPVGNTNPQLSNYTGSAWFIVDSNTAVNADLYAYIVDGWSIKFPAGTDTGMVNGITITPPMTLSVQNHDIYHAVWSVNATWLCMYLDHYSVASGNLVNTTSQCGVYDAAADIDSLMVDMPDGNYPIGEPSSSAWQVSNVANITLWDITFWTTVLNASQASSIYLTTVPTVINTTTTSDSATNTTTTNTTVVASSSGLWDTLKPYEWGVIIGCGSVIVLGTAVGGLLAYRWRHKHYSPVPKH